jgi:hypothetical protein
MELTDNKESYATDSESSGGEKGPPSGRAQWSIRQRTEHTGGPRWRGSANRTVKVGVGVREGDCSQGHRGSQRCVHECIHR